MLRVILVLSVFVLLTAGLILALLLMRLLRLPGRGALSMRYSRIICALLGVRIRSEGAPYPAALILANHVSWLDILVITATAPVIFVAKSEVAGWPLIGWVARARATIFVDRQRKRRTPAANAAIAGHLAEGQSIVLFAEGTSSDGNRVLPFRSALVGALKDALAQAGADSVVAAQPLAIAYTKLQGLPMGRRYRPVVAWYGDRDLVPHVRDLIQHGAIDVTLRWGEAVAYAAVADRKALVAAIEQTVRTSVAALLAGRPQDRQETARAVRAQAARSATPSGGCDAPAHDDPLDRALRRSNLREKPL